MPLHACAVIVRECLQGRQHEQGRCACGHEPVFAGGTLWLPVGIFEISRQNAPENHINRVDDVLCVSRRVLGLIVERPAERAGGTFSLDEWNSRSLV